MIVVTLMTQKDDQIYLRARILLSHFAFWSLCDLLTWIFVILTWIFVIFNSYDSFQSQKNKRKERKLLWFLVNYYQIPEIF